MLVFSNIEKNKNPAKILQDINSFKPFIDLDVKISPSFLLLTVTKTETPAVQTFNVIAETRRNYLFDLGCCTSDITSLKINNVETPFEAVGRFVSVDLDYARYYSWVVTLGGSKTHRGTVFTKLITNIDSSSCSYTFTNSAFISSLYYHTISKVQYIKNTDLDSIKNQANIKILFTLDAFTYYVEKLVYTTDVAFYGTYTGPSNIATDTLEMIFDSNLDISRIYIDGLLVPSAYIVGNRIKLRNWINSLGAPIAYPYHGGHHQIIIKTKAGGLAFCNYSIAYTESGSGGATSHNTLSGIQGGTSSQYYHFTQIQHTDLTDSGDTSLHYHSTDRNRANHSGTQAASTINDFDTEVANNSAVSLNTAKITNATHSGEVTGDGALTVADNVIDEANLKLDSGPTNDYVLTADDGESGGMKWAAAAVPTIAHADTTGQTATDHHSNANDPTTDEKAALAGTSGTPSVTNKFVTNDDSRNTDNRDPNSHAASHKTAGADSIKLDELAPPTDVTTLNATTSAHGLLKKLSGTSTEYMGGDGNWSTPASGGSSPLTTKGDIYTYDSADARLAVGSNDHVLTADSGETTGLKWAAIPSVAHADTTGQTATDHHSNANDPSSDEKAALGGTDGTPSSANKYVTNSDSRNSDARTPTAHNQAASTITDFDTEVSNNTDVAANTLFRTAAILDKLDATTAPTANDDDGDGYSVGSRWFDVTNDKAYVCLDASTAAAVWIEITQSGGVSTLSSLTDVALTSPTDQDFLQFNGTKWVNIDPMLEIQAINLIPAMVNAGTPQLVIPMDVAAFQDTSFYTLSTPSITVLKDGLYKIEFAGNANAAAGWHCSYIELRINGTAHPVTPAYLMGNLTEGVNSNCANVCTVPLVANDVLELWHIYVSGATGIANTNVSTNMRVSCLTRNSTPI